ncbi:E3 SUMO-protein ligase NSE2 [Osmia lignaria lignaria]|uniref:E3 SUMO-protein ligase NSE2 n=1 Tax=Osmia lignaria lignaria TaxID=1437193 RepID=UPI0014794497|nr:E3 SUMO-protein ligase NSE2-like [Osmia lignaria]XP_034188459.1 E3 SUMO-protein ligase NSE2-like [Osmia lignaria]XP_034188460.1 E3 SUMO-protein ligase NSE2-like [Osmia lignaria]
MAQSQHEKEELYDSYTKAAASIISYYEMPERKEKLKELRDIVQNNCVQTERLKAAKDVKKRLLDLYGLEDDDHGQTDTEQIIQEYKEAISKINVDVSNDKKLIEFDKHVEALSDKVEDDGDTDAEMQISGGYINVIDPITKKRIVDPVKNTICGHTYDRDSITEILKCNKKTRCPVVGCKNNEFVKLSHLRVDIVTKTYLEKNPT